MLLERLEAEDGDLVRPPNQLDFFLGLDRAQRLERLGEVVQPLGGERPLEERLRRQPDGVRLAVDRARRDRLEAALEADDAPGRAVLGSELAQVPFDLGAGRRAVVADGRKRPDVAAPDLGGLGRLVLGHEQRRAGRAADHHEREAGDLDVPARRENDVLGEPQDDRIDARRPHRGLDLRNAIGGLGHRPRNLTTQVDAGSKVL